MPKLQGVGKHCAQSLFAQIDVPLRAVDAGVPKEVRHRLHVASRGEHLAGERPATRVTGATLDTGPLVQLCDMRLQRVACAVLALLSCLKHSPFGVLRHAVAPTAVDQRLVRQQPPVWARAQHGADTALDPVPQVVLQGLNRGC